jgi:hypothetical protein
MNTTLFSAFRDDPHVNVRERRIRKGIRASVSETTARRKVSLLRYHLSCSVAQSSEVHHKILRPHSLAVFYDLFIRQLTTALVGLVDQVLGSVDLR